MREEVRKIFLAGVGTAAVTCEKASEVIDKLIEKGKISVEEGKELSEELKRDFDEKAFNTKDNVIKKIDDIKPLTKETLKEVLTDMNYATKADIVEVQRRLEKIEEMLGIENKLNSNEKKAIIRIGFYLILICFFFIKRGGVVETKV